MNHECSRCKFVKSETEFHRNKSSKTGFNHNCKECHAFFNSQYYIRKSGSIKAYNQQYYQKNKERIRERVDEWTFNNLEKSRASAIFRMRFRRSGNVRPPCEICGKKPADAHHPDYSKPMEVKWLCRGHHIQENKKSKSKIAYGK